MAAKAEPASKDNIVLMAIMARATGVTFELDYQETDFTSLSFKGQSQRKKMSDRRHF
ncbi:hypothetical protein [Ferrimonas pelagia]|uniref:Uncharacterized protein n=1 Tax=Ferrimonas pelagia TaxID=1177826 RepID=A0ABP9FIQ4_9GAMM